jgi:hypothetical protein
VFAYLADLEHIPEWNWAIVSTRKVSSGRAGVGARYEQRRSVPRPAVEILEVTELDPNTTQPDSKVTRRTIERMAHFCANALLRFRRGNARRPESCKWRGPNSTRINHFLQPIRWRPSTPSTPP